MKKVRLLSILIFSTLSVYSQFGPQQLISSNADSAQSVFAADIDGDTFIDVLSASSSDDKLAWYRNVDGLGTFGSENVIASLDQVRAVHAADLDGDDDMDVMAVSGALDLVVWYENLDGLGNFGAQQVITNLADAAFTVIAADLDGDMDMDVISGSTFDDKIAWYENLDGQGNFGSEQIVSLISNNGRSIFAADIDNDLDLDLVASSTGSVIVSWFENLDGQGNFGPPQTISPAGSATVSVFAIDLDGDLDLDVVSGAPAIDRISWYENLDGKGSYGVEQIISNEAIGVNSVFSIDLDNDNDSDVLSASTIDGEIAWYENLDGLGNFSSQKIISTETEGARAVYAIDLNNDTAIDVLSASQLDDKVAWYENLTLGITDPLQSGIIIYPNPSDSKVYFELTNVAVTKIELFNSLGKRLEIPQLSFEYIDLTGLAEGLYILRIYSDIGVYSRVVIKY